MSVLCSEWVSHLLIKGSASIEAINLLVSSQSHSVPQLHLRVEWCRCLCSCWLAALDGDPLAPVLAVKQTRAKKYHIEISQALTYTRYINIWEQRPKSASFLDHKYQLKVELSVCKSAERRIRRSKQAVIILPIQEFPWKRANRKTILYTRIKWSKELGENGVGVSAGRPDGLK